MNTDSGTARKEARIAELDRIIQTEEAKPDPDYQLIDDCIREIGELVGAKVEFSEEEVAKATGKIIRKAEREKKRKKIARYATTAAAVFVLVGGVTACTVNPALVDWIVWVTRQPFRVVVNQEEFEYSNVENAKTYLSLDDLTNKEQISFYYPININEYTQLTTIREILNGDNKKYCFFYSDSQYSFIISVGELVYSEIKDTDEIIESLQGDFRIDRQKNRIQAEGMIDDFHYTIVGPSYEKIQNMINSLERIS